MRHALALLLAFASGCSDPAADAPDALRGTCGDAGPGMQWIAQAGCTSTCIRNGVGAQTCRPDGGATYCPPPDDPRNCGACGHDCLTSECAPAGGITYTATCNAGRCRCASP